jgi:hypothetical protein
VLLQRLPLDIGDGQLIYGVGHTGRSSQSAAGHILAEGDFEPVNDL